MSDWLQRQWVGMGFWHILLVPLSGLFWLLSTLRKTCYKTGLIQSWKSPVPVIVVGNISVGGTGKTPLVIWLVEQLKQQGYSPGIISRGYGGSANNPVEVNLEDSTSHVGDEPVLLKKRCGCPVWVGSDRVATAQTLLKNYPECNVIVSDDGLQHYRLQRDYEIAVIDSERGFGNGLLLPAGPLRENISRLKTVDAVVRNGDESIESLAGIFSMHMDGESFYNLHDPAEIAAAQYFMGKKIYAVAGIGNPERFFNKLTALGLKFGRKEFPDHHAFQPEDLQIADAEAILMTEKDAVKCAAFAKENWWYLPVHAVVDNALCASVMNKLGSK